MWKYCDIRGLKQEIKDSKNQEVVENWKSKKFVLLKTWQLELYLIVYKMNINIFGEKKWGNQIADTLQRSEYWIIEKIYKLVNQEIRPRNLKARD